jgi:prolipoprotein diacylglyceryltransferase
MHMGLSFFLLFACIIGLIALFGTVFWIWMIVDCAANEPSEGNDKVMWIVIIVLTNLIGAAIYYFARRPERMRVVGR